MTRETTAPSKKKFPADRFEERVSAAGTELRRRKIEILQVNLGKLCNLTCSHCHVEAGPSKKRENMDERTARAVLNFMDRCGPETLDLTGGAPEMNPHFRFLAAEARRRGLRVIDRCNLTVLFMPGQEDLAEFLAEQKIEIVASLPCYIKENVDRQRGRGTFDESIRALIRLNALGYGKEDSELILNLVYNPAGPHLPPDQRELEKDYKHRLREEAGIVFNRLYAITNMPITRYAGYLRALHQYDDYAALLSRAFNPAALEGLMCLNTLSVGWDGKLYDCDFNQALGMDMRNGKPLTVFDADPESLPGRKVLTADHCFGCTAGAGSSCQGALERA